MLLLCQFLPVHGEEIFTVQVNLLDVLTFFMIPRKLTSKFAVTFVSNSVNSSHPARRRNGKFQSLWFQRLFDDLL